MEDSSFNGYCPIVYSFTPVLVLITVQLMTIFCIGNYFGYGFLYSCGVLVTYSALITGEQGMDLFKSIRPLYLSITSGSSIKELKNETRIE